MTKSSRPIRERIARRRADLDQVALVPRTPSEDADEVIPRSVLIAAAWSWRMIVILMFLALLAVAIGWMKTIVLPILVAIVLTVLLDPLSAWMRRRLHFPRVAAALSTVLLLAAFLGGLTTLAGRGIYSGVADLGQKAAEGINQAIAWLAEGPLHIDQTQLDTWFEQLETTLKDNSSSLASGAISITTSVGNVVAATFLVIFLLIFFLTDGRRIWIWVVRLLPRAWREPVFESSIRGWVTLHGYTKSTIMVAAIDAVGIGLGAFLLGVPLALPIGILVFVGSFIPIVGAILTGSVAVLVALVDKGFTAALLMLAVVLLVQQIESHVLQPFIMGSNVSLHPVAVIIAVAGGTYIAGIAGAVFAVPIVAFLNTTVLYLTGHDKYPRLARLATRPGGPPGTLQAQIDESFGHVVAKGDALDAYDGDVVSDAAAPADVVVGEESAAPAAQSTPETEAAPPRREAPPAE